MIPLKPTSAPQRAGRQRYHFGVGIVYMSQIYSLYDSLQLLYFTEIGDGPLGC